MVAYENLKEEEKQARNNLIVLLLKAYSCSLIY